MSSYEKQKATQPNFYKVIFYQTLQADDYSEKPSLYQMLLWRHLGYENWYISTSIRPVATKVGKIILKIGKILCNEFMEKIWNSLETIFSFFTEVTSFTYFIECMFKKEKNVSLNSFEWLQQLSSTLRLLIVI